MIAFIESLKNYFSRFPNLAHATEIVAEAERVLQNATVLEDAGAAVADLKSDVALAVRDVADVRAKLLSIHDLIDTVGGLRQTVADLEKLVADAKAAAAKPAPTPPTT